jgi:hypothetical protein
VAFSYGVLRAVMTQPITGLSLTWLRGRSTAVARQRRNFAPFSLTCARRTQQPTARCSAPAGAALGSSSCTGALYTIAPELLDGRRRPHLQAPHRLAPPSLPSAASGLAFLVFGLPPSPADEACVRWQLTHRPAQAVGAAWLTPPHFCGPTRTLPWWQLVETARPLPQPRSPPRRARSPRWRLYSPCSAQTANRDVTMAVTWRQLPRFRPRASLRLAGNLQQASHSRGEPAAFRYEVGALTTTAAEGRRETTTALAVQLQSQDLTSPPIASASRGTSPPERTHAPRSAHTPPRGHGTARWPFFLPKSSRACPSQGNLLNGQLYSRNSYCACMGAYSRT